MVIFIIYNFGSVWKNNKSGFMGRAMNSAAQVPV
jgi:hypothetical protein